MQNKRKIERIDLAPYVKGVPVIRPGTANALDNLFGDDDHRDTLELQLDSPDGPWATADVAEFLDCLGATPSAVAATLEALGVKGRPGTACECPIARAVARGFNADVAFATKSNVSAWLTQPDGPDAQPLPTLGCETPDPVAQFIERFDDGRYPYLVEGWRKRLRARLALWWTERSR